MKPICRSASRGRDGFSLVELLIVILIVAVLASLLLVAFSSLNRRRIDTQLQVEFRQISDALEKFRLDNGIYPPSRIILREDGDYSPPTGETAAQKELRLRSIEFLKTIWPGIVLKTTATGAAVKAALQNDWNGDGTISTTNIELSGDQCLVFFLGGIPHLEGDTIIMEGFADSDQNPANRTFEPRLQYFNFKADRLVNKTTSGAAFPVYHDPSLAVDRTEPKAIAYFSAYDGKGYRPNDIDSTSSLEVSQSFQDPLGSTTPLSSVGPNPYTIGPPNPSSGVVKYYKPETFQLIAPGFDGYYGPGGELPINSAADTEGHGTDNMANFSSKRLGAVKSTED